MRFEVLCESVSQGAFEIPLVKVMTFRLYLIKRDSLRVLKFDSLYLSLVSLRIKTYTIPHT